MPKAKNFPSEIDDVTDKKFLNRILRLCGSYDPHCNLSVVGLFLAGQQRRRGDSNNTVDGGADRRKVLSGGGEVGRFNVLHGVLSELLAHVIHDGSFSRLTNVA